MGDRVASTKSRAGGPEYRVSGEECDPGGGWLQHSKGAAWGNRMIGWGQRMMGGDNDLQVSGLGSRISGTGYKVRVRVRALNLHQVLNP